jgi:hypothetical protein
VNLYMVILGCNPPDRFTEQHDVFFGIAENIVGLKQAMYDFWPEADEKLHIDSYRVVRKVGEYGVKVLQRDHSIVENDVRLYFLNLGGYKPNDMEEYHYKQLVVASSIKDAVNVAKKNVFYKHYDSPHIDNKYGIDVDDMYLVNDMLPKAMRETYKIVLDTNVQNLIEDELTIGYLKLSDLK